MTTFWGKYRGLVTQNQDPLKIGRIRAKVPDVYGDDESGWAMPSMPFAGKGMGFFALPTVGAGVWIEFEHGDPDYPIWTGCWWGTASDMPSDFSESPEKKVLIKTDGGQSLLFDDSQGQGEITIQTAGKQKIVMNANSIKIDNGQGATIEIATSIKITNATSTIELSTASISMNNGALEVM